METSRGSVGRAAAACLVAAACAAGATACSNTGPGSPAERPASAADLRPDLSSGEVTDRDLAMAEALGAPQDVMDGLRAGKWKGTSQRKVRYAEAAEDYLHLRYGTSFAAYDCIVSTWIIQDYSTITLRATEGEYEGESCRVQIWDTDDPRWRDDWLPRLVAPELEATVSAAAEPVLEGLPEGTWASSVHVSTETTVSSRVEGTTVAEVGNGVHVGLSVYVSDSCPLGDDELDSVFDQLMEAERTTGLDVTIYLRRIQGPDDGRAFTMEYVSGRPEGTEPLWERWGEVNKNEHPYP